MSPPPMPVFVLGVMKSGTTALCDRIFHHPQLVSGRALAGEPPHWAKELHFYDTDAEKGRFGQGLPFYHRHFKPFPPPAGQRLIDCTPTYLGSVDAPKRLKSVYKGSLEPAKFVVVLRDPVDRAISHWSHAVKMSKKHRKKGATGHWTIRTVNQGFSKIVSESIQGWDACAARLAGTSANDSAKSVWEQCGTQGGIVYRGMVDEQLQHWQQYFPAANFCTLTMDALHDNPLAALRRIAGFLGVERRGEWASEALGNVSKGHSRHHTPIAAKEKSALTRFYSTRSKTLARAVANGGWLNC